MRATPEQIASYERTALERGGESKPHFVMLTESAKYKGEAGVPDFQAAYCLGKHMFVKHTPERWTLLWYGVVPGKPRMTQRDKWKNRPAVQRYHEFCDSIRAAMNLEAKLKTGPAELNWECFLPMPKSWSKKKKLAMAGKPHRQRPDRDNLDKAILDALFEDDSAIAVGRIAKFWDNGEGPHLQVSMTWLETEGAK